MMSPARSLGRGFMARSVSALSRPRPKQGVSFSALIVEQVRVDRRVERGVVELERAIGPAFLGALRRGGTDFGATRIDAVARRIVIGTVGFCDDTDAFGLQAQGDDLALEIVSGLFERSDGSHFTSPIVFRAAT